jgi:hypothetical protein
MRLPTLHGESCTGLGHLAIGVREVLKRSIEQFVSALERATGQRESVAAVQCHGGQKRRCDGVSPRSTPQASVVDVHRQRLRLQRAGRAVALGLSMCSGTSGGQREVVRGSSRTAVDLTGCARRERQSVGGGPRQVAEPQHHKVAPRKYGLAQVGSSRSGRLATGVNITRRLVMLAVTGLVTSFTKCPFSTNLIEIHPPERLSAAPSSALRSSRPPLWRRPAISPTGCPSAPHRPVPCTCSSTW